MGAVDCFEIGPPIGAGPVAEPDRFTTSPALASPQSLRSLNVAELRVFVNVQVTISPALIPIEPTAELSVHDVPVSV